MNLDNIPHVISTACKLHNICETHGKHFNDTWMEGESDQPEVITRDTTTTGTPQQVRNALMDYFQNNKLYCTCLIKEIIVHFNQLII